MVVPARDEQVETICSLIPAGPQEGFAAVELGAGAGVLARAVLERFPACRYIALDGSEVNAYDQPSRLSDQLRWLTDAGFTGAGCFWMRAGHAIFGGFV